MFQAPYGGIAPRCLCCLGFHWIFLYLRDSASLCRLKHVGWINKLFKFLYHLVLVRGFGQCVALFQFFAISVHSCRDSVKVENLIVNTVMFIVWEDQGNFLGFTVGCHGLTMLTFCILWISLFSRGSIFAHFHFKTIRGILKFAHLEFL